MTSKEIDAFMESFADKTGKADNQEGARIMRDVCKVILLAEMAKQGAESQVSLRDRFAMAAMQGLLAKIHYQDRGALAYDAYFYADAMMEKRGIS